MAAGAVSAAVAAVSAVAAARCGDRGVWLERCGAGGRECCERAEYLWMQQDPSGAALLELVPAHARVTVD